MTMKPKQVKDVATFIALVAGIVTGIDKIKTTLQKWQLEYKQKQIENKEYKNS